jgi:hypothetical protein
VRNIASSWPARSAEIGRAGSQIALHCNAPCIFISTRKACSLATAKEGLKLIENNDECADPVQRSARPATATEIIRFSPAPVERESASRGEGASPRHLAVINRSLRMNAKRLASWLDRKRVRWGNRARKSCASKTTARPPP